MKSKYQSLNRKGFKVAFSREASPTDTSHGKDVTFCNYEAHLKRQTSHYILQQLKNLGNISTLRNSLPDRQK